MSRNLRLKRDGLLEPLFNFANAIDGARQFCLGNLQKKKVGEQIIEVVRP